MEKRIHVAVGLLFNEHDQVLVGQRTVKDKYYRKWEFPGGKVEVNENATIALRRELKEELGISVQESRLLTCIEHDYPDRLVKLYVFHVLSYHGNPSGMENQAIQWVGSAQLAELDFLSGNKRIIQLVSELIKKTGD